MTDFWANPSVEPKRQHSWLLYMNGVPSWICKKVTKPSPTTDSIKVPFLNHEFKYPGKTTWESITVELHDPISPDASASLMKLFSDSGYVYPDQLSLDKPPVVSKNKAVTSLGQVKIVQLDADGNEAEYWTLHNAWISDFKFGDLDYSTSEVVGLSIKIEFDWAHFTTNNVAAN
jgi:hypothetical protein